MSKIVFKGQAKPRKFDTKIFRVSMGDDTNTDPTFLRVQKFLRRNKAKQLEITIVATKKAA